MKKFILAILILLSSFGFVFAQSKPLTQAEYVKLLYEAERNPSTKTTLIEIIRKRGIGFELTDGLRGLTRTKSKNDEELRRTLEEANRRRQNPQTAVLPSEKEAFDILLKAREATLAAVGEMPDFVVKQQIQRSEAFAGTNNFRNLDKLVVAVSYRASGNEEYKVLSVNGVLQNNLTSKQNYMELGGATSTGEFVSILSVVFEPENETRFEVVDTDLLRNRRAIVFNFTILRDKAKFRVSAIDGAVFTGIKGRIWLDREIFRVLRVEAVTTDIPDTFSIRSVTRTIDYDWVTIADEKYLLPLISDVRFIAREKSQLFESRNLIRFKDYQKYGTEVQILDEDEEEVQEEKPNQ